MPVSESELLAFAVSQTSSASDEIAFRNAISRSYYAAYHRVNAFHEGLPVKGAVMKEGGMHMQLTESLINPMLSCGEMRKKSKMVGYMCRDLHSKRVNADYNLSLSLGEKDAEQSLSQAQRLFEVVSEAESLPGYKERK